MSALVFNIFLSKIAIRLASKWMVISMNHWMSVGSSIPATAVETSLVVARIPGAATQMESSPARSTGVRLDY
jgi:hypothetical protein